MKQILKELRTEHGFNEKFVVMYSGNVGQTQRFEIVLEAAEFAQTSPEPDPSELWTDILVEA